MITRRRILTDIGRLPDPLNPAFSSAAKVRSG